MEAALMLLWKQIRYCGMRFNVLKIKWQCRCIAEESMLSSFLFDKMKKCVEDYTNDIT